MNTEKTLTEAVSYLAARSRTEEEVRRYLQRKERQKEEIEEIIAMLKEDGYIDDFQYCQEYYQYAAARQRGRLRIESELAAKGVERQTIQAALTALEQDGNQELWHCEQQRAFKIAQKFAEEQRKEGRMQDQKFAARLARKLSNLGYSSAIVYWALGKVMEEKDE